MEEKRVVILPVLLEDCDIPLFLRDKLYADFRKSFDEGLQIVLESIAKVTSNSLGRFDHPEFHIDWAIDFGTLDDNVYLRLTLVEQAVDQPYSLFTEIIIIADDLASSRYLDHVANGLREYSNYEIISLLYKSVKDLRVILDDERPNVYRTELTCSHSKRSYDVLITTRRLGQDTGRNILLDIDGQINVVKRTLYEVNKPDSDKWEEKIQNGID